VVNAFNLVDVMDGLLILVASVATIGLLGGTFLTSSLNRIECWTLLASLAVAFLFNRPPARIYLGDAGALALGFFLASLYLTGASSSPRSAGLTHLFAFAIPLSELVLLTIARLHRGLSPFRGSPDHFALRLQNQAGWTPGKVLVATAAVGLFIDVWCFVPPDRILDPGGIFLVATTVLLVVGVSLSLWRLAPHRLDVPRNARPS
jgi:UDP-GlcNAc:undecaprenyl-phosphate/decaprenyl-phosphate GlcNAc-1-phosphate transferase